jgi:predicted MFS family arabinose efflux permease
VARPFLIDLAPLRASRDFRLVFVGQTVSMVGSQLSVVALAYQVYARTGSSFQVGTVSLAQLVPFVTGALAGGVLGDHLDQRHLLIVVSALASLASLGLALNATAGTEASILAIYLVSALAAGLSGVLATLVTAAVPSLVERAELSAAFATMQVVDQLGMVLGPALAGVVIAGVGLAWLYGIDAITFVWTALLFWPMSEIAAGSTTKMRTHTTDGTGVGGSFRDGLRYLRGRQDLPGAYLLDLCATVFGLPRALFPAIVRTVFHRGPAALGLFYAAPAAGALLGSLTSGWIGSIHRQGRAVIVAVALWGAVIAGFGLSHTLLVAVALLAAAGWVDLVSAVLRSTIVQSGVAEQFRSRVSSLQMAVVEGGPRLGDLESGTVARLVSTQFSVVSGGIACVVGALAFALFLPDFRRHDRRADTTQ